MVCTSMHVCLPDHQSDWFLVFSSLHAHISGWPSFSPEGGRYAPQAVW